MRKQLTFISYKFNFKKIMKPNSPLLIFLIHSLNCLIFVQKSSAYRILEEPRIKVDKFLASYNWEIWEGDEEWITDFTELPRDALEITDQGRTIIVSNHLSALSIVCNASYPVQWMFEQAELAEEGLDEIIMKTSRESNDVNNPKDDRFIARLELLGFNSKVTGRYNCVSLDDRKMDNSIYVYWKGSSPPFLVLSGKTIHVQSNDNITLVLPCYVSQPDIDVKLYQEISGTFQLVSSGMGIRFDPKIGFTIDMKRFDIKQSIYGRFKCVSSYDDEDYLNIIVERELRQKYQFPNIMSSGTGFYHDPDREEIVCCSKKNANPPSLRNVYCLNSAMCQMRLHELYKVGNNGKKNVNGSCISDKIYSREHTILRCKGDGIDIFRSVYTDFSSLESKPQGIYFNWKDIKSEKMMHLTIHSKAPYFHKQMISVTCEGMNSYFSDGHKWAIRWRNLSLTYINPIEYEDDPHIHGLRTVDIKLNWRMLELFCYIPVWNSTDWVSKTVKLDVQRSSVPVIDGLPSEELRLSLNDTEKLLECRSLANPLPTIIWKKNGEVVPQNMVIFKENGLSILMFNRVTHDTQAEYQCIAKNYAGESHKVIHVFVVDTSSSAWGTTAAVLVPILVIAFIGTAGALIWKMQLQKKVVDHLSRVVFRDAQRQDESSG